MKTHLKISFLVMSLLATSAVSKGQDNDTTFYMLTCGPGTDLYSIYGHSALLLTIGNADTVYNWGVFDFDTPNFAWKFAKGRLNYKLAHDPLKRFLTGYFYEKRYVVSQKINLKPEEERRLLELINENLKPENVSYRYDFFYDDCSTRIRNLLEKATNDGLVYPPETESEIPTFRQMVAKYQRPYPWIQFGIDLLMGSPGDKPANVRDRMFLPIDMMEGLTETRINRNGKEEQLLHSQVLLIDLPLTEVKRSYFKSPFFVFSVLLVIIAFLTVSVRSRAYNNLIDYILFFIFAVLAAMMIFFNFFTDHDQMRSNYNIVWLNPFLILCFIAVLVNRWTRISFRIVFFMTCIFLAIHLFLPQAYNVAIYPLIIIILLRSLTRSEFSWNPLAASEQHDATSINTAVKR